MQHAHRPRPVARFGTPASVLGHASISTAAGLLRAPPDAVPPVIRPAPPRQPKRSRKTLP